MSTLAKAIALAAKGFEFKTDKGGKPYILHPIWVMNDLNTTDEELQIIAILHDCVEDKICSVLDLVNLGFSQRVVYAVILLTHDKEKDTYDEYIKRVETDVDATKVKLSDLKHNLQISRLKKITKKDFDNIEKYNRSYVYLSKI